MFNVLVAFVSGFNFKVRVTKFHQITLDDGRRPQCITITLKGNIFSRISFLSTSLIAEVHPPFTQMYSILKELFNRFLLISISCPYRSMSYYF